MTRELVELVPTTHFMINDITVDGYKKTLLAILFMSTTISWDRFLPAFLSPYTISIQHTMATALGCAVYFESTYNVHAYIATHLRMRSALHN